MFFRMIYDDKLAQAAYLIGCQRTGQALLQFTPHSHQAIQTITSQLANTNRPSQRISSPTAVTRELRMSKS